MNWIRARLTIQAWRDLAIYDLTITSLGFRGIHRRLMKKRSATCRQPLSTAVVCEAVNLATCLYLKQVHCLQRSVVSVLLLRKCGIPASLVIAYRPSPFFAHSWVEVDGQIVNDSPAFAEQLIVLYRQ
ncbi:MAG: lasso peptide biosynthesis B2 protein [Acidimicrobiia bacterium]|nr:lasso peptide biosynthesis B2 protein [Acidimicrobiia bacterium]